MNIRTASGLSIPLQFRYYRRRCDKKLGKRHKGVYPGVLVRGLHERSTPLLASRVSAWSALLSAFAEVQQVLREQSIELDVKVLRRLAYRYAQRARNEQQRCAIALSGDDTLAGKRVVISCDGGRVRLRENKCGPKTKKGRSRDKGAWREPKLLVIYAVNAAGR